MTLIFAPLSGRIVGRRGPRVGLLVGGLGITLGAALLTELGAHTSIPSLVPAYVIFGIGFGMVNPPITNTAVLGMPPAQAGVAAAVASTSRQIGQTLGVAIVGAIAAAGAVRRAGLRAGESRRLVDRDRLRRRGASCSGWRARPRGRRASARRVAEQLDPTEPGARDAELVGA